MTGQLELLARCALPGCPDVVPAAGDVCAGCVQACGPYLARREPRPEVTPEQITDELAERDRGTIAAYAAQAAVVADAHPAVTWRRIRTTDDLTEADIKAIVATLEYWRLAGQIEYRCRRIAESMQEVSA